MYLHGEKLWFDGNFNESVQTLRNALEFVGTPSEKGLVLFELGRIYEAASGVDKYMFSVSEGGESYDRSGSEQPVLLDYLDKAIDSFSEASNLLSGTDAAKAKYQIALATHCKVLYFDEIGQSARNKDLLVEALEQLRSGAPKLNKYDKLHYCFFMHLMALLSFSLYEITHDQRYQNSGKEYCAAAVRAVTENHLESSLRSILDFCLSS